jgi:hypothetical protein
MAKRVVLILVGVLLLVGRTPLAQVAGPSVNAVSGVIAPGSPLTISGTGFGTKLAAPPLRWDDFEGGANGAKLTGWTLDASDPSVEPTFSNVVKRPNSRMSGRSNFINGNWDSNFGITGVPLPRIYLDAWYYYDVDAPYNRNHKPFRIKTNTVLPNMYYGFWCANSPGGVLDQDGMTTGHFAEYTGTGASAFSKKWTHIQGYFEESTPNVDDGTAVLSLDGVKIINTVHGLRTRTSSGSFWNTIWIGHYFGHDSDTNCAAYGDAHTYWDDVYLDTTLAHVEISDVAVYDSSRHREIQIPTSWSNTSITVTLNRGSFASFTGLYLFVIDSAGNASVGAPIVAGPPPPPPPPDTTPPTVVTIAPTAGATAVTPAGAVTAVFSESMNPATINSSTFELRDAANAVVNASVTYNDTTRTATLQPAAALGTLATYTPTVKGTSAGVKDLAGNALVSNYTWSFTTASRPPATGPVASYGFEEASGSAATDQSGNNNNGTFTGATRVAGKFGNGLSFNGTTGAVTVPDSASLDLTTGMTLEAWVNPTALTGWRTAVLKETAGDLAYALYASDGTRPVGIAYAATKAYSSGTAALPLNTWTHLAATYDGATVRLFVNGTLAASAAATGPISVSSAPLRIGGNSVWGEYFAGTIDEVRVYNRALSQTEIQADMNTPVTPPADTVPPSITSATPAASATGVALGTSITATFSEPMSAATIGSATFELRDASNALVARTVTYDSTRRVATLQPSVPLAPLVTYTAIVKSGAGGVKDVAANPLASNYSWTFTTGAATGLVASYSFEESAGTSVIDRSGNNNSGILTAASRTPGKFGSGLSLDGMSARMTVADSSSLDLRGGMTLEAWVLPTTLSAWRTVILKETTGELVYALYASDGTHPATVATVATKSYSRGAGTLTANRWTHLAATYDGATLSLFVDGVLAATQAATGNIATSAAPLQVGGNAVWGEYFAGVIDEVRVYNRPLNPTEIQADMNTPITRLPHPPTAPKNVHVVRSGGS